VIQFGNERNVELGGKLNSTYYVKVYTELRAHLKDFGGPSHFLVFMAIALHSNASGWSRIAISTIMEETGIKSKSTVISCISDLLTARIDLSRVLIRIVSRAPGSAMKTTARYKIFPSASDCVRLAKYDDPNCIESEDYVTRQIDDEFTAQALAMENPDKPLNDKQRDLIANGLRSSSKRGKETASAQAVIEELREYAVKNALGAPWTNRTFKDEVTELLKAGASGAELVDRVTTFVRDARKNSPGAWRYIPIATLIDIVKTPINKQADKHKQFSESMADPDLANADYTNLISK